MLIERSLICCCFFFPQLASLILISLWALIIWLIVDCANNEFNLPDCFVELPGERAVNVGVSSKARNVLIHSLIWFKWTKEKVWRQLHAQKKDCLYESGSPPLLNMGGRCLCSFYSYAQFCELIALCHLCAFFELEKKRENGKRLFPSSFSSFWLFLFNSWFTFSGSVVQAVDRNWRAKREC